MNINLPTRPRSRSKSFIFPLWLVEIGGLRFDRLRGRQQNAPPFYTRHSFLVCGSNPVISQTFEKYFFLKFRFEHFSREIMSFCRFSWHQKMILVLNFPIFSRELVPIYIKIHENEQKFKKCRLKQIQNQHSIVSLGVRQSKSRLL